VARRTGGYWRQRSSGSTVARVWAGRRGHRSCHARQGSSACCRFWIRVYAEVDNGGFLHDASTTRFRYENSPLSTSNTSPRERERNRDQARLTLRRCATRIAAAKDGPYPTTTSASKGHVGLRGDAVELLEAIDDIRFPAGAGGPLSRGAHRSGAWETHIAEALPILACRGARVLPQSVILLTPPLIQRWGQPDFGSHELPGRRYMRIDRRR